MAYIILEITKEISFELDSNWMSSNDSCGIKIFRFLIYLIESWNVQLFTVTGLLNEGMTYGSGNNVDRHLGPRSELQGPRSEVRGPGYTLSLYDIDSRGHSYC